MQVLHLANCYLFFHQGPERQKDRYLCLKRSPPWRSCAFSRLSIAILQVRLAFLHEVWLLKSEGSYMSFCQSDQIRAVLPSGKGVRGKAAQEWTPESPYLPPLLPLGCPNNCSSSGNNISGMDPSGCLWDVLLLPYCLQLSLSFQGSKREQSGHGTSLLTACSGFRLQTRLGSTRPCSVKLSLTFYCSLPCALVGSTS